MEVHHHGKKHEGPKIWKLYLEEFLMLFFAVFLGYQAENYLEHSIERTREKEYMEGFARNLRSDTAQLGARIATNTIRIRVLDSMLTLSRRDLSQPENTRLFYQYYVQGTFFPKYRPNDATLVQLKNSGGLRLVHNSRVADSITAYDANNRQLEDQAVFYQSMLNQGWDAVYPIMDVTITRDTSYILNRMLTDKEPPALNTDPAKLKYYFGIVLRQILIAEVYNQYMQNQLNYATRLLPFVIKEYDLDEEEEREEH